MRKPLSVIKAIKAFTIIELMVGIFVTILAVGTFFKLYTNSLKAERSTNLRTSVSLYGDQMIESISNSIRLLGLNNEYVDFDPGSSAPGTIITSAIGGSGNDVVTFSFRSPYGGPISQLSLPASGSGTCTFTIGGSTALHSGINSVQLMSNKGIYLATGSISGNVFTSATLKDRSGANFSGNCATDFPAGTLITGSNNNYTLTYVNAGADTTVTLNNATTGESIINFSSNAQSAYQIPYFVFQFLREYTLPGNKMYREWVTTITDPVELQQVKAIRVGFVMLSTIDRTKKKVATAGLSTTLSFCPFENMCYNLNDINKTAYVFRRVIYIKNFDYLKRNADISY
ncbi:MAG TPA: hypothetical protein PLZ43_12690 [bacterium]|nr:hypothetical protein [bacterium]